MLFGEIVIFLFLLISAIADYCQFCYFWQLKEYRFDRFKDFLKTKKGKNFLISYIVFSRFLFVIIAFLAIFFIEINIKYLINLFLYLLSFELLRNIFLLSVHQLNRPKKTAKAIIIIALAVIIEASIFILTKNPIILFSLVVFRFVIFSSIVGLFFLPTSWAKKFYLRKAFEKISAYDKLLVIGITGSYGKTTVKNFLFQILNFKFKILKTPKNINTEIGIAKFILKTDFSKIDIFIVEMGAYKAGEIKIICDMVKPKIGILTAINEQHLSLFGSLKNTQKAKYELLRSLPKDGLAIINSDNFYCREHTASLDCQVKTFGENKKFNPDFLIDEIKIRKNNEIVFTANFKNLENKIVSFVKWEHNIMNIAPCFLVADYLKIKKNEIIEQCKMLKAPSNSLQTCAYGKSRILDDSYNSNPDGFIAALAALDSYSPEYKKIVITRGMLELGKKSKEAHKKIGEKIAQSADELIIISPDFEKVLKESAKNIKVLTIFDYNKLLLFLQKAKEQKNIILLENRMPSNILEELKK